MALISLFEKHHQWPEVKAVAGFLRQKGFKAYLVGGAVRDGLRGMVPNDFDLVTNAKVDDLEELFPEALEIGKSFGIFILPRKGFQLEVASFRADGDYSDGRRPDSIRYGTAKEDAARRDFTVNSLFMDIQTGEVIDYYDGQQDIKNKFLRTVGEPESRFQEDHLRILRALRFSAQLNFEIHPSTFEALVRMGPKIETVAKERILGELDKMWASPHRGKGLHLLAVSGVLPFIFTGFPLSEKAFGQEWIRLQWIYSKLKYDGRRMLVWAHFFMAWVRHLSRQFRAWPDCIYEISFVFKDLKFTKKDMQYLEKLVGFYPDFKMALQDQNWGTALRLLGADWGPDLLDFAFLQALSDGEEIDNFEPLIDRYMQLTNEQGHLPPPLVSGNEIIELGVEKGPLVGWLLKELYDQQLAGALSNKKEALTWIQSRI